MNVLNSVAEGVFRFMALAMVADKLNVTKPDIKAFFSDFVETSQLKTRAFYLGAIDLPAGTQQTIKVSLEMIYRSLMLAHKHHMLSLQGMVNIPSSR